MRLSEYYETFNIIGSEMEAIAMVSLDRRSLVGHCVIRRNPWHFLGIYATRGEAEQRAKQAGGDYEVAFGTHQEGTDDFEAIDHDQSVDDVSPTVTEYG